MMSLSYLPGSGFLKLTSIAQGLVVSSPPKKRKL